jgi:hypothetical protein
MRGVNYKIFREYEAGVFGEFNKYTQNNSIQFQSLLGRPYVYMMSGLGFQPPYLMEEQGLPILLKNLLIKEVFRFPENREKTLPSGCYRKIQQY